MAAEPASSQNEPVVEQSLSRGGVSRREFLRLSARAGAASVSVWLTGCLPATPQPSEAKTAIAAAQATSVMETRQAPGIAPEGLARDDDLGTEDYSQFFRQYNLLARVHPENETPMERAAEGMNYLRRLRDALKDNPNHGPSLKGFGFDAETNFPIDLGPDGGWTMYDYIDAFVKDYFDNGQIEFVVTPNTDPTASYSTTGRYEYKDGKVAKTKSIISIRDNPYSDQVFIQETSTTYFKGRSLLDNVFALVHEYGHVRQEVAEANYMNAHPNEDYSDMTAANRRYFAEQNAAVALRVARYAEPLLPPNQRQRAVQTLSQSTFPYNECQPDTIAMTFLHYLNELNENRNGGHFPGTRRRDPVYKYNLDEANRRSGTTNAASFYDGYKKYVLDPLPNQLNPNWLLFWAGYR